MSIRLSPEDRAFMDEVGEWFEENTAAGLRDDAFMFGTMTAARNIAWGRQLDDDLRRPQRAPALTRARTAPAPYTLRFVAAAPLTGR